MNHSNLASKEHTVGKTLAAAFPMILAGLAVAAALTPNAWAQVPVASDAARNALNGDEGLCFLVDTSDGWPTLRRSIQIKPAEAYDGSATSLFCIELAEGDVVKPTGTEANWTTRRFEYNLPDGARATVAYGRLSPAVLVDSTHRAVRFAPPVSATVGDRVVNSRGVRGRGTQGGRAPLRSTGPNTIAAAAERAVQFVAFVRNGKVVVHKAATLRRLSADELALDEPWVLGWFGSATPLKGYAEPFDVEVPGGGVNKDLIRGARGESLDLPILFRLERAPSSVSCNDKTGLAFTFAKPMGKMAVMPLFGRRVFLPGETARWTSGLPDEVLEQARRWSAKLRDFPIDLQETYARDAAEKTLTVHQEFQWVSFADQWQSSEVKAAPLPPMLALALGDGMKVSFRASDRAVEPVDYNLMDMSGLAMGIEGVDAYEYQIHGLGDYLWPAERKSHLPAGVQPVRRRLEAHIGEMIQSGHLAPLFYIYGGIGGPRQSHWYWVNSTQLAQALAMAHPYLSEDMQDKVRAYLASDFEAYPAFTVSKEQYVEGAPRQPYFVDWSLVDRGLTAADRDMAYRSQNHLFEMYGLERYLALANIKPDASVRLRASRELNLLLSKQDWAIAGPVRFMGGSTRRAALNYQTLQGSATYNRWLAGVIGVSRLAKSTDWREELTLGMYLAGKLAIARTGQARYVTEMHRRGWVRGLVADDDRAVSHIDPSVAVIARGPLSEVVYEDQEFPPLIDLVEPIGRMLSDWAKPGCRIYLDNLDESAPLWFLSEAPKQSATEQRLSPLQHHNGNVLAMYWVLNRKGDSFAKYVDVTRFKGDLYHIQNVSALLQSYADQR